MADGGLAAHLGRTPLRAVRGELARAGPVHPDPRLAASRGTGPRRALQPRRARSSMPMSPGSTPGSTRIAAASGSRSSSPARTRSPGPCSTPLTWGKVQAWNLGGNMSSEVFRFLADARLGDPSRTDELFATREFGPVIVPGPDIEPSPDIDPLAAEDGGTARTTAGVARPAGPPRPRPSPTARPAPGATSPRSATTCCCSPASTARLAASPRITGSAPTTGSRLRRCRRRAARCSRTTRTWGSRCRRSGSSTASTAPTVSEACPFDVAGVSFPGVPGVVLGHNARIAWGATNAAVDVQDLVIETVDPADPTRYLGPDGASLPFTTRTEQIAVSGGDPDTIEVRETVHGPILNDVDERLADSPLMALRWSAIHPVAAPDRTLRGDPGPEQGGRLRGLPRRPVVVRRAVPELRLRRRGRAHRLSAAWLRADPLRPRRPRRSAGPGLDRRRGVARPDPLRAAAVGAGPGRWLDRDRQQRGRR